MKKAFTIFVLLFSITFIQQARAGDVHKELKKLKIKDLILNNKLKIMISF